MDRLLFVFGSSETSSCVVDLDSSLAHACKTQSDKEAQLPGGPDFPYFCVLPQCNVAGYLWSMHVVQDTR